MTPKDVLVIFSVVLSISHVQCNFWGIFDVDYIYDCIDSLVSDESDDSNSEESSELSLNDSSETLIRDIIDLANKYHNVSTVNKVNILPNPKTIAEKETESPSTKNKSTQISKTAASSATKGTAKAEETTAESQPVTENENTEAIGENTEAM